MENLSRALASTNLNVEFKQTCGMAENSSEVCARESDGPKSAFERKPDKEVAANDNKMVGYATEIEVIATYELCNVAKYLNGAGAPVKWSNVQKPIARRSERRIAAKRWTMVEDPEKIEVLSSHEIPSDEETENSDENEEGYASRSRKGSFDRNLKKKKGNFYQRIKHQIRRFLCMGQTGMADYGDFPLSPGVNLKEAEVSDFMMI